MARVIESCLDETRLTWSQLVIVLRQPALKKYVAATIIERNYVASLTESIASPPQSPTSPSGSVVSSPRSKSADETGMSMTN